MKKFIVLLVFFSTVSLFSQTKDEDIRTLLEIMNVKQQAEQIFELLIPQIQNLVPNVPRKIWERFLENLDLDGFVELYIPIYDRHYNQNEIRELIAFYQSPIGKKVIEVTPKMTAESMSAGQMWGAELGKKIIEQMIQEGYLDT